MIKVLEKSHKIMLYLSAAREPQSLHDIAGSIKESDSTTANIIRTMKSLGYVKNGNGTKLYSIGPAVHYLARHSNPGQILADTAGPLLEKLSQTINETCHIVVDYLNRRTMIMQIKSGADVQIIDNQDALDHLYKTCTGILLLAAKNDSAVEQYYAVHGDPGTGSLLDSAPTLAALMAKLQIIRKNRHFINAGNSKSRNHDSAAALGFSIFHHDHCIGALGVKMPAYRYTGTNKSLVNQQCKNTVMAITDILNKNHKEYFL